VKKTFFVPKSSEKNYNLFLGNTKDLYFLSFRKKSFHVVESAGKIKDLHALEPDSRIRDVKCSQIGKKTFFVPKSSERNFNPFLSLNKKKVSMLLNHLEG
jgi:hypothetical protein